MKIRKCLFFLTITALLTMCRGLSQSRSDYRIGRVIVNSMCLKLDSVSIVPSSFFVENTSPKLYTLDPFASKLYLKDSSMIGRTLIYHYTTYSMDFSMPFAHKSSSLVESKRTNNANDVLRLRTMADLELDNNLLSSGSITRGVSVGSNQDLVLNSALNLQLSGKLSDHIGVVAAISDKNIPIQPEGNTQYISNINSIFITLNYDSILVLNAGDVGLTSPNSHFLAVSRNFLGMNAETNIRSGEKLSMKNVLGGGVAKGKFVRQKLEIQNGVQGPYRLYGENQETSIVVVSGSERVYVDGELMTRGQDNDYIVDYNTAEVTFTPRLMITSEKRVFVEFEYTDRHFVRGTFFSYNELSIGKKQNVHLKVNFFHEQDLKNQSVQPELSMEQKKFLSQLDAEEQYAYYNYADSTEHSPDRILYCRKDTIVAGETYHSVYVYSNSETEQLYSLGFTYMGPNRGSYILLRSTSNGRVFGWVAPENGELRGEYDPVIQLSTPKLTQMATIQAEYNYKPSSFIKTELAVSNYDNNTFSKKDNGNNVGFAYFVKMNHEQNIRPDEDWKFASSLDWQYVHKNFHIVESFREVEFARNYNLTEDFSSDFSEQMLQAMFAVSKENLSRTQYSLNWFSRIGSLSAIRQELKTQNAMGRFSMSAQLSYLNSKDSVEKSNFLTFVGNSSYRFRKLELGLTDKMEYNLFKDRMIDSTRLNSYAFNEIMLFLQKGDSSAYHYNFSYKNRWEFSPENDRLKSSMTINEVSALFQFDHIKNQRLSIRATYRNQQAYADVHKSGIEHYFLGSLDYSAHFLKNVLVLNTYYEAGSGMEQKKNFTFLKVASGQGTHVWNDYNNNGIEEIDEFEVSVYADEANYVKVWLNGIDYVNTYNNQFVQSVQLRPLAIWGKQEGFRRFLARFTDIAAFRSQLKHMNPMFNPFYTGMEDTNLVGNVFSFNNTHSFKNRSTIFAFDFVAQKIMNKSLLYYGFEQNENEIQKLILKSKPCDILYLQIQYVHSNLSNQSEFLKTRCYLIEDNELSGIIQLQFQNKYISKFHYSYENKNNKYGVEKIMLHSLECSFDGKMAKRGVVNAALKYLLMSGKIDENGSVSYQMLNGLALGHNLVWAVSYQLSITDYLQLSLQYEGRASQGHKIIHVGNITMKAQF